MGDRALCHIAVRERWEEEGGGYGEISLASGRVRARAAPTPISEKGSLADSEAEL